MMSAAAPDRGPPAAEPLAASLTPPVDDPHNPHTFGTISVSCGNCF